MPTNVEIKARVPDLAQLRSLVEQIADGPAVVLEQEDIFYHSPSGRLKLRILGPGRGEVIWYHRPDVTGPKTSQYKIAPTTEPRALQEILGGVLPTLAVVRKRRWLYVVGQTRIHLDTVADLGKFVELEVVLRQDQSTDGGAAIANDLMVCLNIVSDQLIDRAYVDLLP